MTYKETLRYQNYCHYCKYRKQAGGILNQYGVGRCLPSHCNNPDIEPIANQIYHMFKQDGDARQWDLSRDDEDDAT